ncbi:MAG: RAD55 family ATPase, partial [Nitrososphaeria archaeon]
MRDVLEILTTPGYVSVIEGPPGIGKTFLALKACSLREKCTYISYAEPEGSLRDKMKFVAPEHAGELRVISAMSGSVEGVYSEVAESLSEEHLVVIDTVDAMFFGLKDESQLRPFLQLLYASVKGKSSSMILITEGLNPVAGHIRFVADALVSLSFVNVLGQETRAVRTIKDRDHPVEHPLHYITLHEQFRIFHPFYITGSLPLGRFSRLVRPLGTSPSSEMALGNRIVYELDMSVEDVRASLLKKMLIADFIKMGYKVNYLIGPNEEIHAFLKDIETLLGSTEGVNIFQMNPRDYGYKADRMPYMQSIYRENAVNIVNLLAVEDFALKEPVEY